MSHRCCLSLLASANATLNTRSSTFRRRSRRFYASVNIAADKNDGQEDPTLRVYFPGIEKTTRDCVATHGTISLCFSKSDEAWPCREKDLSSGGWFGNKSHRHATRIVSKRHWWIRNAVDAFQARATETALINSDFIHISAAKYSLKKFKKERSLKN